MGTSDQFIQAMALEMGRVYDPGSGRFMQATDQGIQQVSQRMDMDRFNRQVLDLTRPDQVRQYQQEQTRRYGFGTRLAAGLAQTLGVGAFSTEEGPRFNLLMEAQSAMRNFSNRNLNSTQISQRLNRADNRVLSQSRTQILDMAAQQYGQRNFSELDSQQQANLLATLQQGPYAEALGIQNVDFTGEGMTNEQFNSMMVSTLAQVQVAGAFSGMGGNDVISLTADTAPTPTPRYGMQQTENVSRETRQGLRATRLIENSLGIDRFSTGGVFTEEQIQQSLGGMNRRQRRFVEEYARGRGFDRANIDAQRNFTLALTGSDTSDFSGDFDTTRARTGLALAEGMLTQVQGGNVFERSFENDFERTGAIQGFVQSRRMQLGGTSMGGGNLGANDEQIANELRQLASASGVNVTDEQISMYMDATRLPMTNQQMAGIRIGIRSNRGTFQGMIDEARAGVGSAEQSAYGAFIQAQLGQNLSVLRQSQGLETVATLSELSGMGFNVNSILQGGNLNDIIAQQAAGTLDENALFSGMNQEQLSRLQDEVSARLGATSDRGERERLQGLSRRLGRIETLGDENAYNAVMGFMGSALFEGGGSGRLDAGTVQSLMEAEVTGSRALGVIASAQAAGSTSGEAVESVRSALVGGIRMDVAAEASALGFGDDQDAFIEDVIRGGTRSRPAMQAAIERMATSADFQDADRVRQDAMERTQQQMAEALSTISGAIENNRMRVAIVSIGSNLQFGAPADGTANGGGAN